MPITIALAGNPNCGKTTMFNDLTGATQFVGNWPGVTVEKKEGRLRGNRDVHIMDLPGVYSLSPYTLEEVVSRDYLLSGHANGILNLVDGSNLERNLYLTTQLLDLGLPMVVAVNMIDVVRRRGDQIDLAKLSEALGCPVVETAAVRGEGTLDAAKRAAEQAQAQKVAPYPLFSDKVERAIGDIELQLPSEIDKRTRRWFAIKVFERDEKVLEQLQFDEAAQHRIDEIRLACEDELDDDAESIITNERYTYIAGIIADCLVKKKASHHLTTSDKIDRVVTNRLFALPIFALVMFCVYYIAVTSVGKIATDWTNGVLFGEIVPTALESFLVSIGTAEWLVDMIINGIVAGVGAVLGFLPQMAILFFMLCMLEDCGYMARVAFIMDRIFRKFGLSGKSFIPMLISSGCGVPGIMASRTIENEKDRRMTIMVTTFIPCGAKLPVIALIASAIFGGAAWIAPTAYFAGVAAIVISGILLKKTQPFSGDPAPFVMELPAYHWPTLGNVLRGTWERTSSFAKKAGSVILLASIFIWFTSNYGFDGGQLVHVGEEMDQSMLASWGMFLAPIFAPLGFGDWKSVVATISGLVAKESVVNTFGILFHIPELSGDAHEIWDLLAQNYTAVTAFSFMMFNLLCAPCFAAIGAIKREMNSAKWTWFAILYECGFAYAIALFVNQFGGLATGEKAFGVGTVVAIVLAVLMLWMLVRPTKKTD